MAFFSSSYSGGAEIRRNSEDLRSRLVEIRPDSVVFNRFYRMVRKLSPILEHTKSPVTWTRVDSVIKKLSYYYFVLLDFTADV